ncbi:Hypothetical protein UVM_LOCUS378 [uncultured virus]|nr:Hypothetical protein UVM_LOCUS378 [uncultured virus]
MLESTARWYRACIAQANQHRQKLLKRKQRARERKLKIEEDRSQRAAAELLREEQQLEKARQERAMREERRRQAAALKRVSCAVCLVEPATILFQPCRHCILCGLCVRMLDPLAKGCILCRSAVDNFHEVAPSNKEYRPPRSQRRHKLTP